jgi:hypothetical protein
MPPLSSTLRVRGDAAAATSEPRNLKCVLGPVNDPQKTGRPAPAHRSPRREPGGTAGRWAIPAPGSQCSSSPPTRPKRVPKRTNPGISTLPQAPGRAGAISPDARSRHPAFRSLDAGLAFAILASLGQHTPARLAPAHPSRTRSSGARRISALARAAPALPYRYASAVSAGAGPYLSGAIVKLARPWLTLRTAAE